MRRSILLAVGTGLLALGFVGCCSTRKAIRTTTSARATPCDHAAHDNVVLIRNNQVSCDEVMVSIKEQNTVQWIAPGHRLEIRFKIVNPFEQLICGGDACAAFSPGVDPSDHPFEYSVYLDGERVIDPNVIIRP